MEKTTELCSICRKVFHACAIQRCNHSVVNRKYGTKVCRYCCKKCKHNIETDIGQECELRKVNVK
nr:MAG TPA: hypothetical protein [Caudoviricetes sp.]